MHPGSDGLGSPHYDNGVTDAFVAKDLLIFQQ